MYTIKNKNIKPKSRKKIVLLVLIVVFFIVCIYMGVAAGIKLWPFEKNNNSVFSNEPTEEQKNNNSKDSPKTADPLPENQPVDPNKTTDQIPTNQTAAASITQLEQSNGVVTFTGKIDNVSSAGECVVEFSTESDRPITKQVGGTVKDSVALCGPITVSELEFSYLGQWKVNFKYYVDGQVVSTDGVINIR